MSIDLNNDMQDSGVAESITKQTEPVRSEFSQTIEQNNEVENSVFNYRSNAVISANQPFSFEEVRNLSAPELSDMILDSVEGKSSDEIIQDEYKKNTPDGREQAILVEAMRFGSQSALYERLTHYQNMLEDNQIELSRIFNFSPLLLANGRVVPPVIVEMSNLQMVEDRYTRRDVDKSYKIVEQAKVVSTPLTWRNYLYVKPQKPNMPSKYALPIRGNEREEKIWANGVSQGWEAGLKQANRIMIQNTRKLERDYIGMVRYKIMLEKNQVTSPIPANINLGVTTDGETMNIGEVIFEMVEAPKFNRKSETWKALPQTQSPIDF